MKLMKNIFKLFVIQFIFCSIIVIILTIYKFFLPTVFIDIEKYFAEYANYDTDISLVYEGQ